MPETPPPDLVQDQPTSRPETPKRLVGWPLLALLLVAWIIPGLVDRDPWKADEAYSFGLVLNMVETGNWVVPTLAAEPFMEKPPAFYITATIFTKLLSPLLAPHDAARAACIFYLLLTLLFLGLASRELNGPGTGWVAGVLLLGCLGLVHNAHMLVTDNSLLTGFAIALYGLALGLRKPFVAGLVCGTGAGLAFLSKGLLGPGIIGVSVLCLPVFFKEWRERAYWRLLAGISVAILPWLLLWPLLLYHHSPDLFMTWFWNNNIERFLGVGLGASDSNPLHYLKQLPLLAFPVLPLAAWTLWRAGRAGLGQWKIQLPLLYFLVTFFVLSLAGQRRSNYALPMFLPLALLALPALDQFGPKVSRITNRLVLTGFSIIALMLWFAWSAQFTGVPHRVLAIIHSKSPDFAPGLHLGVIAVAIAATLAWTVLVFCHRRRNDLVFLHWTAGIALVYLLAMTIWLPVINGNMTYRNNFIGLREAVDHDPGTVAGSGLGEPQRAMIHYFAGIKPVCDATQVPLDCHWMLVQSPPAMGQPKSLSSAWQVVWSSTHHRELFQLYHCDHPRRCPSKIKRDT